MRGKRIAVEAGADPWLKLKDEGPGAYYGPVMGFTGEKPAVFFIRPNSTDALHHVVSPPHTFTEDSNGLTIRASIGCLKNSGGGYDYHGFLTDGEWSEA